MVIDETEAVIARSEAELERAVREFDARQPPPPKAERRKAYTAEQLDAMDDDELANAAGGFPT